MDNESGTTSAVNIATTDTISTTSSTSTSRADWIGFMDRQLKYYKKLHPEKYKTAYPDIDDKQPSK